MQKYINMNIKEIIDRFSGVGDILREYDIACVSCNVGTCLFRDIIEIHNLSPDEELEVLTRIAGVIYPDREVEIPLIKRKNKTGALTYSPPIRKLVDEHDVIKRLLEVIPRLIGELEEDRDNGLKLAGGAVDFIRSYADRFHHAKEEDILFRYFDENTEIFKVMRQDHEEARAHVRAIMEALDRRDPEKIAEHLKAYRELLTEHIKKEDEVLYPWLDKNLSTSQVGALFSKFMNIDETFGDVPRNQEAFIELIEVEFCAQEPDTEKINK